MASLQGSKKIELTAFTVPLNGLTPFDGLGKRLEEGRTREVKDIEGTTFYEGLHHASVHATEVHTLTKVEGALQGAVFVSGR